MKKVRIANSFKFTRGMVLLFLTLYVSTIVLTGGILSAGDVKENYIQYTVVSGDTLWSIAKAYTPTHEDVRSTIHLIQLHNTNADDSLIPGEILFVPGQSGDFNE